MPRVREPAPDVTRIDRRPAKSSPRPYRNLRREAVNEKTSPSQRTPRRAASETTCRHLARQRRLPKTPGAAFSVDGLAHVGFRDVHALTTRRAHQCVVMKGGDDPDSPLLRDPGQIELESEKVMNVQHVGCCRIEHVPQLGVDAFRRVRLVETVKLPVVHQLDDCQPSVLTPADGPVWGGWIVLRGKNEYVVVFALLARQLARINLRSRAVPRQEIMNGVENSH